MVLIDWYYRICWVLTFCSNSSPINKTIVVFVCVCCLYNKQKHCWMLWAENWRKKERRAWISWSIFSTSSTASPTLHNSIRSFLSSKLEPLWWRLWCTRRGDTRSWYHCENRPWTRARRICPSSRRLIKCWRSKRDCCTVRYSLTYVHFSWIHHIVN